jgi:hypothetical protein
MRRLTGLPIAMLFLAALAAWPASAQQILPNFFSDWTRTGDPAALLAKPDQPILSEYRIVSYESARFSAGKDTLDVGVYKMKDPSGAYGLYSFLRTPETLHSDLTEHASLSRDRALFLVGDLVLEVRGSDLTKWGPQLKSLVVAVKPLSHDGPLPLIGQHLPPENRVVGTDRYILGPQTFDLLFPGRLGNSLGFQTDAEAELAHYRLSGGRDATLVIADFPTPQIASAKLEELQSKFNVNGAGQNQGAPLLFASRSLTMLTIVSGASSQTEANTLLDQVRYDPDLTWNEPTFQFKEPSIEMMIEGSIVGAMTICIFALIAGLSFGGLRLIVKRVAPGKVFDRSNHLQVLQLGLGSKAINSDDFYGYSPVKGEGAPVDKNLPDRVALRIFR